MDNIFSMLFKGFCEGKSEHVLLIWWLGHLSWGCCIFSGNCSAGCLIVHLLIQVTRYSDYNYTWFCSLRFQSMPQSFSQPVPHIGTRGTFQETQTWSYFVLKILAIPFQVGGPTSSVLVYAYVYHMHLPHYMCGLMGCRLWHSYQLSVLCPQACLVHCRSMNNTFKCLYCNIIFHSVIFYKYFWPHPLSTSLHT